MESELKLLASLFDSVRKGSSAAVRDLLSAGADANADDAVGVSLLHRAVLRLSGNEIGDKLGDTPVHKAAPSVRQRGSRQAATCIVPVVQQLLAAGASVHATNNRRRTPLMSALEGTQQKLQCMVSVVQELLAAGADVSASDSDGSTPLHLAVCNTGGAQQAGDLMTGDDLMGLVQQLLAAGASVHKVDKQGRTPLHDAAECTVGVIQQLLAAGADVNAADQYGVTPLHNAVPHQGSGQAAVMEQLLAEHIAVLKALLAAGAAPGATDRKGTTPMHVAVKRCIKQWTDNSSAYAAAAIQELATAGADTEAVDSQGRTVLQAAVIRCAEELSECYEELVHPHQVYRYKPDPVACKARWQDMKDTLDTAAARLAHVLLLLGANAGVRDSKGRVPLQLAARWGLRWVVQLLIPAGAYGAPVGATRSTAPRDEGYREDSDDETTEEVEEDYPAQPLQQQLSPMQQQQQRQQQQQQQLSQLQQQQPSQPQQQPRQQPSPHPAQPQKQQVAAPQQRSSARIAGLLHKVKTEPELQQPNAAAAAAGSPSAVSYGPTAIGSAAVHRPASVLLLQQAMSAGFYFPNEQQLDYYMLADQPFSTAELQQLHSASLTPMLATRSVANSNRSGAIRESVVTVAVDKSRIEHNYPAAVSAAVVQIAEAVPQLSQRPQQQQRRPKKQKVSTDAAAAAAPADSITQTDAASKLLLVLRCFQLWESRQVHEKELPQLLQLPLYDAPEPAAEGVVEAVDLVSDDENEQLDRQLLEGGEELLVTKEVQPRQQQQQQQGGGGRGGEPAAAAGTSGIKREPGL